MASQNKANPSSVALFTKIFFSKSSLFPTSKKQSNSPWVDLSSKLASNGKLTSDKYKKHLKNKLDSLPKKQTTVSPKGRSASATADTLAAASKKPSEK